MMEDILARLERLERIVGAPEGGGDSPAPPPAGRDPRVTHKSFRKWLTGERPPGQIMVVGAVAKADGHMSTSLVQWDKGGGRGRDWRAVAGICQALGSESRLGILRELEQRPRTTADLMAAVGLDRGQLYHHLKDLFVQGFVEQPERGRYVATPRGERAFLLSVVLHARDEVQPAPDAQTLDLGDDAPGGEQGAPPAAGGVAPRR